MEASKPLQLHTLIHTNRLCITSFFLRSNSLSLSHVILLRSGSPSSFSRSGNVFRKIIECSQNNDMHTMTQCRRVCVLYLRQAYAMVTSAYTIY